MKFKAKRLDKITERVSFNKETRAKDYIHKYSNFQSQEDDDKPLNKTGKNIKLR